MKAKKYEGGGTVTKKMVKESYDKKFKESANFANDFAKYAETGIGPNGMPLSAAKKAKYAEMAKRAKKTSTKMKPAYNNVGLSIPKGESPKFGKGGKLKKYLKGGQVKLDANKDGKITGTDFMMMRKK